MIIFKPTAPSQIAFDCFLKPKSSSDNKFTKINNNSNLQHYMISFFLYAFSYVPSKDNIDNSSNEQL